MPRRSKESHTDPQQIEEAIATVDRVLEVTRAAAKIASELAEVAGSVQGADVRGGDPTDE